MNAHPILARIALAYSPVIDRQRSVIATRLTVFPLQPGAPLHAGELLQALGEVWPEGGSALWLNVLSESLLDDLMQACPPKHIALEIPAFMATDEAHAAPLLALHAHGNPLLLKGRPRQDLAKDVLGCFTHAMIDWDEERRVDEANGGAGTALHDNPRVVSWVQAGIGTVDDMETAFRRGAVAVLGWPLDHALQPGNHKADQPTLQAIVALIDAVHREADLEDLEAILKRDPALAFKLLRYINSPGFGLSVEVGSFKHAIMVLGYQRLKRWLALLLATASKDPNMRPVMFAAVRRGLAMEQLGKLGGDAEMAGELFLCGVFSLLDKMFGQPFADLLKTIPVPEQVHQVLVEESGPYAPYLHMIRAIEGHSLDDIRQACDGLMLSAEDTNLALLRAVESAASLD